MGIVCTRIASAAKKICIMAHLLSLSVCEFTEIFQIPKQTTCLTLLAHLNQKQNKLQHANPCDAPWMLHSLFCWCLCSGKHLIPREETQHSLLENMLSAWGVRILLQSHKTSWFQFFYSKYIFVHVWSLLIVYCVRIECSSKISSKCCNSASPPSPPALSTYFCKFSQS